MWKNRYLTQITKLHVITAFLKSQNHNIKMIEIFTKQAFSFIMYKFFNQYLSAENAKSIMKKWLRFRDQKKKFHQDCECWSYQTNSKLFWNFCRIFSLILSCLTRRVMMLSINSVLIERNWSIMNLIMTKFDIRCIRSTSTNWCSFTWMNERWIDLRT